MTTPNEPSLGDVLAAINGLRVTYREDLLALRNDMNRGFDALRGEIEQRFGILMEAMADHVKHQHGR